MTLSSCSFQDFEKFQCYLCVDFLEEFQCDFIFFLLGSADAFEVKLAWFNLEIQLANEIEIY